MTKLLWKKVVSVWYKHTQCAVLFYSEVHLMVKMQMNMTEIQQKTDMGNKGQIQNKI